MRSPLALACLLSACSSPAEPAARPDKVYVCAQDVGVVDVLDGTTLATLASIPTGAGSAPHNAEVTPDGARVLVTSANSDDVTPDELIVIDPATDTIVARVPLDVNALVAHVVVSPGGRWAFVTGWASSVVYRVDLLSLTRGDDIILPGLWQPHGLRLSEDGAIMYTANAAGSVAEIHVPSGGVLREIPLPGPGVQVAVTPDRVFASVFDPPSVAVIDRASGVVTSWSLPEGAKAPAQVLLSPTGGTLFVTEQGDSGVPGHFLFELDTTTGQAVRSLEVGLGAHGVAMTPDGSYAYVTGMFDSKLAMVDLTGGAAAQLGVTGRGPRGVALWYAPAP